MCGIVGFTGDIKHKNKIIKQMTDCIIHRGPDGEGFYIDESISLGHRRLSIIDIDGGHQPMSSSDESIVVVFNGEIYNFMDLRIILIKAGYKFKSDHSDTEVLIHGYLHWGIDGLLKRIKGMFVFVIYDKNNNELYISRDHFGIKPLYYYLTNDNELLFASELKCLLKHPNFIKVLNDKQLQLYLSYQYSVGEDTFFKGVYKLMPGHYIHFKNDQLQLHQYFKIDFDIDNSKSLNEWTEDIQNVMKQSIERHMISDVKIGSFLSSGVDSSYIVANSDVTKTFTVGYKNQRYDESSYAKKFSDELGIENITEYVTAKNYFNEFGNIQYYMDEPLGDGASVSFYFINKRASDYVKVCLSGEGADEMFGGYNIYKTPFSSKYYNMIPEIIRIYIAKLVIPFSNIPGVNFIKRNAYNIKNRYIGSTTIFEKDSLKKLYIKYDDNIKPIDISKPYLSQCKNYDDVTTMQYVDLHLWMVGDILLKADKMSMANSLELRVPFIDIDVFRVASKIPLKYKVNKNMTKIAFRKTANKFMKLQNANKPKLGFPVPIRDWIKEEQYCNKIRKMFNKDFVNEFFDINMINKLLSDHYENKKDYYRQIWCIYSFLVWYEQYFILRD